MRKNADHIYAKPRIWPQDFWHHIRSSCLSSAYLQLWEETTSLIRSRLTLLRLTVVLVMVIEQIIISFAGVIREFFFVIDDSAHPHCETIMTGNLELHGINIRDLTVWSPGSPYVNMFNQLWEEFTHNLFWINSFKVCLKELETSSVLKVVIQDFVVNWFIVTFLFYVIWF